MTYTCSSSGTDHQTRHHRYQEHTHRMDEHMHHDTVSGSVIQNKVLTDTAAVPCCHPLFVQHPPVSPSVFTSNLTFSSYEEFQKHLESYQQNNPLFLYPVPYYLPGKTSFKL